MQRKNKKIFRLLVGYDRQQFRPFGGLGDALLTTPIFPALKKKFPDAKIHVFSLAAYKDVFSHNPHVDTLRSLTSFWKWYLRRTGCVDTSYWRALPSAGNQKPSEIIAQMLGITIDDPRLSVYLRPDEDEKAKSRLRQAAAPVITIHITSSNSPNQMWPIENWNELVRSTPQFKFMQLGLESEQLVEGVLDMRGQTSIRESCALIKHSACFVGVVSSMAHATSAVGTPGVVFYGPSAARVWGHSNLICLDKNLPCAPCVDLLRGHPCPYGRTCMTSIAVDEVKAAILKQVKACVFTV
jgi:ADP-heptose:LPS heptosyltransferase